MIGSSPVRTGKRPVPVPAPRWTLRRRDREDAVRIGLLGPLDVRTPHGPVALTSARQRAVLALLAMSAGSPVPVDRLVDAVWGDDPPPAVLNSLQSHIARLRRALGGASAVVLEPGGYRLDVDPGDPTSERKKAGAKESTTKKKKKKTKNQKKKQFIFIK